MGTKLARVNDRNTVFRFWGLVFRSLQGVARIVRMFAGRLGSLLGQPAGQRIHRAVVVADDLPGSGLAPLKVHPELQTNVFLCPLKPL